MNSSTYSALDANPNTHAFISEQDMILAAEFTPPFPTGYYLAKALAYKAGVQAICAASHVD